MPLLLLLLQEEASRVSPINIFAGCKLNIKNPKQAPQRSAPSTVISTTLYFAEITERHAIIIIEVEAPKSVYSIG